MEVAIPVVVLFLSPVALVWLFQHFAAKKRLAAYKTLESAIEKGQPLTPETLEGMARLRSPIADLRWGIVFVAIAAAFAMFATIIGWNRTGDDWPEITRALYGIAVFPLFIGLAFLGLHFFANENKRR